MALPVPDKTWQFNVNQAMPDQGTTLASSRRLMRTIKNSLVGFGSNPWTVRYSSNGSVAGSAGDGVDRWTADTDLVWAAGNRSWMVLRQTGIATNFELCIDLNFAAGYNATMVVSPAAGFTGGTIGARPTATDEFTINSTANGWGTNGGTTGNAGALHVMQSTDGQVTYVVFTCDNRAQAFWMLARPKNPATGWSNPSVSLIDMITPSSGTAVDSMLLTRYFGTNATLFRGRGTTTMNIFLTSEGTTNGANNGALLAESASVLNSPNDFSGEYPMFPIGFASKTTGNRGRHGQIFDMWLGLDITNIGDTYPNDTSRQFVQFGDLIFPWNGSVPLTA